MPARQDLPSVMHCFRAPVGGVFRHVRDLATGQAKLGLKVGVICDATTGGDFAKSALEELARHCTLGVHRLPMLRRLHLSDIHTRQALARICRQKNPAVVHGHGAKGGAFARLLSRRLGAKVIYTPHGGVLHYAKNSLAGRYYFALERYLRRRTDGLIFASEFGAKKYVEKIGRTGIPYEVIHNGLGAADFEAIPDGPGDYPFVFVGELRKLKGLDTLFRAMAQLAPRHGAKLLVCGDGPDAGYFATRLRELELESVVTMAPPVYPATAALARAECVVIPSHAESFPYIVLETAAAGVPLIATSAGGIPEIFGPYADRLVTPGDADALAAALAATRERPDEARQMAHALAVHVKQHFRVDSMVDASLAFYRRVIETDR